MDNISQKIVRIISQNINYNWKQPFNFDNISKSIGSGFFINNKGLILTCSHVVDDSKEVYIQLPSEGKTKFKVDVLGICPYFDIALLEIKNYKNKYFLNLGDSDKINIKDESFAVGFPLGQDNIKITKGIISGKEDGLFQTDTAINPGNSGGPLIINGKVIGINSAGISESGNHIIQNVGFSVPINYFNLFKNDILKNNIKLIKRNNLGIRYVNLNTDYLEHINLKLKNGILITHIDKNSPIYKIGLRENDILYSINNILIDYEGLTSKKWMKNKLSIRELVMTFKNNEKIKIEFFRKNTKIIKHFNFTNYDKYINTLYPLYENIDYFIIGGLILMNLNNNLINKVLNEDYWNSNLIKYTNKINIKKPLIIITDILPNSIIDNLNVLKPYEIITKINNKNVSTFKSLKSAISKPIINNKIKFIKFETENKKTIVLKLDKILKSDNSNLNVYKYNIKNTLLNKNY